MTESAPLPTTPIPWADALALGRRKGLLVKELFAVTSTPTAGIGPVFANLQPHLAFQAKLEADGTMFGAGPLSTTDDSSSGDGSVWDGTGMFIYRAESLATAIAIAEQDPMHTSGARTFQARAWMLNEGTLTIRISYASGEFKFD